MSGVEINLQLQRFHKKRATGKFHQLLPKLLPPNISINYTNFHNFLGKLALQIPVGKSCLTAPFMPQPSTSQNQPLTIRIIETPAIFCLSVFVRLSFRAELLEAWLALTSVKYHDNLLILMLLNQWYNWQFVLSRGADQVNCAGLLLYRKPPVSQMSFLCQI